MNFPRRRSLIPIAVFVLGSYALGGVAIAQMGPGTMGPGGMMGPGQQQGQPQQPGQQPGPGMMGPGMMGGGMMGSGMMGNAPGRMMGAMLANMPGARVSPAAAQALGDAVPAGAVVERSDNHLVFHTTDVRLTMLASPEGHKNMTFRAAGLANPTIMVPRGATVTLQLINADQDTSHGWMLTAAHPPFPYMAMMSLAPAFADSAAMPLGDPTAAGMHSETVSFTATAAGRYTYLCPVAGHAQQGMYGTFIVSPGATLSLSGQNG